MPGPVGRITLPIILKGKREGTGNWTWNGNTDTPTLRPSLLSTGTEFLGGEPKDKKNWRAYRCHTWITDLTQTNPTARNPLRHRVTPTKSQTKMTSENPTYTNAILSGDTYRFREILKRAGWQYDGTTKTWCKAVAADSKAEDVLRQVRGLGGIRNRGNLSVIIA